MNVFWVPSSLFTKCNTGVAFYVTHTIKKCTFFFGIKCCKTNKIIKIKVNCFKSSLSKI